MHSVHISPPRIVLVHPSHPANVGFVARLLANFSLADWAIVAEPLPAGSEADRTSSMARDTLSAARWTGSLDEALHGCTHALGFTARTGKHRRCHSVSELPELAIEMGPLARPAFVFGPEDRGLESEETDRCSFLVSIPVTGLPSLNLSHAVAVALYEWHRKALPGPSSGRLIRFATAEEKRRLARKTMETLAATGYRLPDSHLEAAVRRLEGLGVEARDLRILERLVRHMEWLSTRGPSTTPAPRSDDPE
jgi:tRNA/rRNA methyltransferase